MYCQDMCLCPDRVLNMQKVTLLYCMYMLHCICICNIILHPGSLVLNLYRIRNFIIYYKIFVCDIF